MKLYIVILLTAVLSASAASAAWYVCYKKAVKATLARSNFSPSIVVTQRPIERVSASITVPHMMEAKDLFFALAEKLSRVLPDFWLVRKTVDYDITYTAEIWICRPPEGTP